MVFLGGILVQNSHYSDLIAFIVIIFCSLFLVYNIFIVNCTRKMYLTYTNSLLEPQNSSLIIDEDKNRKQLAQNYTTNFSEVDKKHYQSNSN